MHAQNFSVCGIRKIWHAMNREGLHIDRDSTERLMKLAGVHTQRPGRRAGALISPKTSDQHPDLVKRNFRGHAPRRLLVADITCVQTLSGCLYTAFVVDVFSRTDRRCCYMLHETYRCAADGRMQWCMPTQLTVRPTLSTDTAPQ